jgi:hypothetical protein
LPRGWRLEAQFLTLGIIPDQDDSIFAGGGHRVRRLIFEHWLAVSCVFERF